jgi:uncharacterized protein
VYAHRRDSEWHAAARQCLARLAEGREAWGVPWPCIHEFLAIATHLRIYRPPTPVADAVRQVEYWMESPSLRLLGEMQEHWHALRSLLTAGKITGGAVHDARAMADRDFTRMGGITIRNPLVA